MTKIPQYIVGAVLYLCITYGTGVPNYIGILVSPIVTNVMLNIADLKRLKECTILDFVRPLLSAFLTFVIDFFARRSY